MADDRKRDDGLQEIAGFLWGNWARHKMADATTSEDEALKIAKDVAETYRKGGLWPSDTVKILHTIDERFGVLKSED